MSRRNKFVYDKKLKVSPAFSQSVLGQKLLRILGRIAKMSSVLKKGDRSLIKNDRRISMLNTVTKYT